MRASAPATPGGSLGGRGSTTPRTPPTLHRRGLALRSVRGRSADAIRKLPLATSQRAWRRRRRRATRRRRTAPPRGEAPALTAILEVLDHRSRWGRRGRRATSGRPRRQAEPRRHGVEDRVRVVGDEGELEADLQLEVVEPCAGCARNERRRSVAAGVALAPADSSTTPAFIDGMKPTMSASRPASSSTRLLPPPMAIGGWGCCSGLGVPSRPVTWYQRPDIVTGPSAHSALMMRAIRPSVDALGGGIERDTRCGVVADLPAGPETELEAPLREEVERGGLFGDGRGVPVVVGEDHRRDAEG